MNRMQRAAVLLALINKLREGGSWCGETHIQKAVYFLEKLSGTSIGYDFILYKHGPFSFELRDELTAMRADGLLDLKVQAASYGPCFIPTELGLKFMKRFPRTMGVHMRTVEFVTSHLSSHGVASLERLATALYVTEEDKEAGKGVDSRAERIHELKPHIDLPQAKQAVKTVDQIIKQAGARS